MAFGDAGPVDFNFFLARKYAMLQQNADADTKNSDSQRIQATSNAEVAGTTAALNRTQNRLAPAESASRIAAEQAQSRLLGEQASVVAPTARANIANLGAETRLTGLQGDVLNRTALTPYQQVLGGGSALGRLMGGTALPGFGGGLRPAAPVGTARLPGEGRIAYMDRTGIML